MTKPQVSPDNTKEYHMVRDKMRGRSSAINYMVYAHFFVLEGELTMTGMFVARAPNAMTGSLLSMARTDPQSA